VRVNNKIVTGLFILFGLLTGCATSNYHTDYDTVSYHKFSETGYASFYGHHDGFDGERMANGHIMHTKNLHIAAHASLPIGTKLKVTDLSNHKVLYVEVTDRMAHIRHRIIDLSYGAAKYFGMQKKGLVRVHIKTVTDSEYRKHI